jgi:opacity protein-like surface antigen
MRRILAITALSVALSAPAMAQDHAADPDKAVSGGGSLPTGWMARTDKGAAMTNVKFVDMAPGWHITLGPAAIFYQPADTISGNARLVALLHMTPPKPTHPESYGIFLGGQDLEGPNQSYTYFLIRADGKFMIKRRMGEKTTAVMGWTENAAVKPADADGLSSNELSVEIKGGKVSFMANGTEVYSASAADVDTKGVVGVRINHNLSIHLEKLQVNRM